ncbi:MAG: thiamine phosphate synthase [Rhodospirillales bacterium]|nr:thiamine phosphate synthase [Rhodospirillales bacterium]
MASLAELCQRLKSPAAHPSLPRLIAMTDSERSADPLAVIRGLPAGSAVIFRERDAQCRQDGARRLRPICRHKRILLLIAGDWRLARQLRCDGLHLSDAMLRAGRRHWHRCRPSRWLVTTAAHSPASMRRAAVSGVDAVLLSPVFPTKSHPGAPPLGVLRFVRWTRSCPLPVFALGGVNEDTARRLAASRAMGFAAISAFLP